MAETLYNFFLYILDSIFSMAAVYTILGAVILGEVLTSLDNLYQHFKKRP